MHFPFANIGLEANPNPYNLLPAPYDHPFSHPVPQLFRQGLCHQVQGERPGIAKINVGVPWPEARKPFGDLDF